MYSKVYARIWSDEKFKAFSIDARYLLLYLLTCKHRNVLGCYQLPFAYAIEDTELTKKRFQRAWDELCASGIIMYDDRSQMILLKNFLKYNPLENPNQVKGALTKITCLPKSNLFQIIYDYLKSQNGHNNKQYLKPLLDTLPTWFASPLPDAFAVLSERVNETPSKELAHPVDNNNIHDHVTGLSMPIDVDAAPSISSDGSKDVVFSDGTNTVLTEMQVASFNLFWNVYPRKVSLGDAEREWAKLDPDDALTETIINGVKTAIRFDNRFRQTQYTPHPASWLKAKSWADQYDGIENGLAQLTGGNDNGRQADSDQWREFQPSTGFRVAADD